MAVVTIVVPTCRRPRLLRGALNSLARQTMPDFVALVCDNAAQRSVADLVADHDDRFVHVPRERNVGLMRNAVLGFGAVRTPFAMKLDDDDALTPTALERLLAPLLADERVGISGGRPRLVDGAGRPLSAETAEFRRHSGLDDLAAGRIEQPLAAVVGGALGFGTCMIRADFAWEPVPDEVDTAYDLHVLLSLLLAGHQAHHVRHDVTLLRRHPDADTNTHFVEQCRGALAAIDLAIVELRRRRPENVEPGAIEALELAAARTCVRAGRELVRAGDPHTARVFLRRAIGVRPGRDALRLWALAHTPAGVGGAVSRARHARHERSRHGR